MHSGNFDAIIQLRLPSTLRHRLRLVATDNARKPADIVREGIMLQIDRLGRRKSFRPHDSGHEPPQAA